MGLSGKEIEALKELEERSVMEAKGLWQEQRHDKDRLVREGYLKGEDLLRSETWMRQRIFAHVLEKKSETGEALEASRSKLEADSSNSSTISRM